MSQSHAIDVTCPECQNSQKATVWSSINVTLHPYLKEELLEKSLNVFCCNRCHHRATLDASLLYHDMEARYCIQYLTEEDVKSPAFYSNLRKNGTVILDPISAKALAATGADHFTRPHHVFSMEEMRRYIAFRERCAAWGKEG